MILRDYSQAKVELADCLNSNLMEFLAALGVIQLKNGKPAPGNIQEENS